VGKHLEKLASVREKKRSEKRHLSIAIHQRQSPPRGPFSSREHALAS